MSEKDSAPSSGLLNVFVDEVIPTIEGQILRRSISNRSLLGFSMGGLNSSLLALKKPTFFKRVALWNPAIVGFSPHTTDKELKAFLARNPPEGNDSNDPRWNVQYLRTVMAILTPFLDTKNWNANMPLQLAPKLLNAHSVPMLIMAGKQDITFFEGAETFARLAKAAGAPVIWSPLPGNDYDIDSNVMADFLVH